MLAKAETWYGTVCFDCPHLLGDLWASVPYMKCDANSLIMCLSSLITIRFIFQYVTAGIVLIAIYSIISW